MLLLLFLNIVRGILLFTFSSEMDLAWHVCKTMNSIEMPLNKSRGIKKNGKKIQTYEREEKDNYERTTTWREKKRQLIFATKSRSHDLL
jgi:hypothetical protein